MLFLIRLAVLALLNACTLSSSSSDSEMALRSELSEEDVEERDFFAFLLYGGGLSEDGLGE